MSNIDPQNLSTATGMEFCTTGWFNATVKTWNTLAISVVNKDILGAQFSTSFLDCNALSTTLASVTCRLSFHAVLENVGKKCDGHGERIITTNKLVEKLKKKLTSKAVSCEAIGKKMENIKNACELRARGQEIVTAATQVAARSTVVCAAAAQAVTRAQSTLANLNRAQGTVNQSLGRLTRAQGKAKEHLGALNEVVETSNSILAEGHENGEIMTVISDLHIM